MDNTSVGRRQLPASAPDLSDVDSDSESEQLEQLSKNTLFEILKNQRRRDALWYLKRNEGTATLSDMAEHIAAKENGIDVAALSSSQRKRVYIGLYQCHLPKMAASGVVDFDKNRGSIELRPEASQLDAYLEDDGEAAQPAPTRRNLAVAGGIGAAVAASVLGVPGFVVVPDVVWAVVSAATLVVLTAMEARRTALSA